MKTPRAARTASSGAAPGRPFPRLLSRTAIAAVIRCSFPIPLGGIMAAPRPARIRVNHGGASTSVSVVPRRLAEAAPAVALRTPHRRLGTRTNGRGAEARVPTAWSDVAPARRTPPQTKIHAGSRPVASSARWSRSTDGQRAVRTVPVLGGVMTPSRRWHRPLPGRLRSRRASPGSSSSRAQRPAATY